MVLSIQSRFSYLVQVAAVCGLLVFSLYLQFYHGILPCPLCSLQRISFAIIGLFSFITFLIYPYRCCRLINNTIVFLVSIAGLVFAGRQAWLQHFPPAIRGECSPSLEYMITVLPLNELFQKIFAGSAECINKSWEFIHISMAEWGIIWFFLFTCLSLYLLRCDIKRRGIHS